MKEIVIPRDVNMYAIRDVVISFRKYSDNPDEDKKLIIDLTEVEFVQPSGVIALNNIIQWVMKHSGVDVGFRVTEEKSCVGRNRAAMDYLADCGFFSSIGQPNVFKKPKTRSTMLSVKDLDTARVEQWKVTDFKKWLQNQTGKQNEFTSVCTAIDEIFNNISDHSQEKIGCIFGQYYPKNKEIIIAVSDFGIGIPQSIKNKFQKTENDDELIEFALGEGVSSQSIPQNRGAGLANIMKTLTTNSVGEFTIISNCGIVNIKNNIVNSSDVLEESYPGTFFEIKIDTSNDNLYDLDEEEEFKWW